MRPFGLVLIALILWVAVLYFIAEPTPDQVVTAEDAQSFAEEATDDLFAALMEGMERCAEICGVDDGVGFRLFRTLKGTCTCPDGTEHSLTLIPR